MESGDCPRTGGPDVRGSVTRRERNRDFQSYRLPVPANHRAMARLDAALDDGKTQAGASGVAAPLDFEAILRRN